MASLVLGNSVSAKVVLMYKLKPLAQVGATLLFPCTYLFVMQKFINWALDQGVLSNAATVQQTNYADYGLFATQDIEVTNPLTEERADTIIFIPEKLIITAHEFYQGHPMLTKDLINEKQALRLFLIYCRYFSSQQQTSAHYFWKPYIDILPTFDYFKENHILFNSSLINGTNLERSVNAKLLWLEKELVRLQQQEFLSEAENWILEITLDMYLWADCVMWSRVVGIGEADDDNNNDNRSENLALIPFFDFANHSFESSNIRWQWMEKHYDSDSNRGIQLVPYNDRNTTIKKGDELLLNYGQKPNGELLFLYGFCIENNPTPIQYTLPILSFLDINEPISMLKVQWLKQMNAKPALSFKLDTNVQQDAEIEIDLRSLGISNETVSLLYLTVADDEIGELNFSKIERRNAVNAGMDSATSESLTLGIGNENIDAFEHIRVCIEQQQKSQLPIIQLRVVLLLIDAFEYQQSVLLDAMDEDKRQDKPSPNLIKHTKIYMAEEQNLLLRILSRLYHFRNILSEDQAVVEYLSSMQV